MNDSSTLSIPDSYDQISETLGTAELILDDAVENAKRFFILLSFPLMMKVK